MKVESRDLTQEERLSKRKRIGNYCYDESKSNHSSGTYQYNFREVCMDPGVLSQVREIFERHTLYDYPNPEFHEAQQALFERIAPVIPEILTTTQLKYLKAYYFEGLTQWQVAEKFKVTQSAVTKALQGNHVYNNGTIRRTPGALYRIRKYVMEDPELFQLYRKMVKARGEDEL